MTTHRCLLLALLAALLVPSTAMADAEPNDTAATANGPLRSDVRQLGALGRDDDADHYALYVDALRTVTITAESLGGHAYFDGVCVELLDGGGERVTGVCPAREQPPASVSVTVRRGRYVLRVVSGDEDTVAEGATYAFTVSAPGGLVGARCFTAHRDADRYRRQLDRARRRLAVARDRFARRRTRDAIRDLRLAVRTAEGRQELDCAP